MSSGQRPRTPEHFPRMKVRGHHRRFRRMLASGEFDAVIQQTVNSLNEMMSGFLGIPKIDFGSIFNREQRVDMTTAYLRTSTAERRTLWPAPAKTTAD